MIILVAFTYILTFFTRYNLRSDDLNIYIPYIEKLIYGGRLGPQYDYQAFYWILSLYQKAFYHFFPNIDILPMGLIVTSTTIVLFVLIYLTFRFLYQWLKKTDTTNHLLFFVIMMYTLFQFWYIVYPSYGNTFRRLNVVWILMTLSYYMRNPNQKLVFLMSFELLTLINFSSTGIFLNAFLLYGIAHLFAYTKQTDIFKKIWILSIPFSIWLILYNIAYLYPMLVFHCLMMVMVLIKKMHILDALWIKYHNGVLFAFPLIFTLCAWLSPSLFAAYRPWINFFTNPEYEMLIHYLRFDFSTTYFVLSSLVNIGFWSALFYALYKSMRISKIEVSSILYLIFILLLTFFNPFVARFVISNLTQLAYFRIYDILFNPFTLYLYFWVLINSIQHVKIKRVMVVLSLMIFVMGTINSDVWPYLDFSGKTDPIHHVNKDELNVFKKLEDYVAQEEMREPINIIVQIHGAHLLTNLELNRQTSQRINNIEDLFSKQDDGSKLNQIFLIKDSSEVKFTPPYKETCQLTQAIDTQFVIVEAQYNWDVEHELGYCAEKIFEVGNYRVFRMRYEWLSFAR